MAQRSIGRGFSRIYNYICLHCGTLAWSYRTNVKACSGLCQIAMKPGIGFGKLNPKWNGGKYTDENGYVMLSGMWEHPNRHPTRGTVQEHRVVMEHAIGRKLRTGENVHHKNGIRSDNRIGNLELWSVGQPSGQRVKDIVSWVVDNYTEQVRLRLDVLDAVETVLV